MNPRVAIRFLQAVFVVIAVVIAAFPLFVLLDLARGGTGYGLCPTGVGSCRNPYTAAPELMTTLTVGLVAVLGGFRVTTKLLQRSTRRSVPPASD
jgi:hypothetical protein